MASPAPSNQFESTVDALACRESATRRTYPEATVLRARTEHDTMLDMEHDGAAGVLDALEAAGGGRALVASRLRRTIDRVAVLRSLAKSAPVQHLLHTARAGRAVREPLRFVALQLGPPRAAGYRLRDSGLKIFLRHRTRDLDIFKEIFVTYKSYDPPAAIASALDANTSPAVLDLGANIGLFGAYVLGRWPSATIQSFEPDPTNLPMLTRVIAANDLEGRWSVADVAVANHTGEMPFVAGLSAVSHLAGVGDAAAAKAGPSPLGNGQTILVRTVDVFDQDHDVDLMKMDIEGGEWSILTDPRLGDLRADVLVLEWHANGCPEPDAHATAVRLLREAGYSRLAEVESLEHRGLLWAWRENGLVV